MSLLIQKSAAMVESFQLNFFFLVFTNSALAAWKVVWMPKKEEGLGLFDIKARKKSFLAKQLWNIHLKSDSI